MPNITVYFPNTIKRELDSRGLGNGENVVARDLERYYTLLAQAKPALTEQEMNLLRDTFNGVLVQAELVPFLPRVLADAVAEARADGLDEKWGVDADALAEKMLNLSTVQALALVDSIEQFWESQRKRD
jgi:hypothetical protein